MKLGATDKWKANYKALQKLQLLAAGVQSFTVFASQYEIPAGEENDNIWYYVISVFQGYGFYITVGSIFVLWACQAIKQYMGNPWAWETVKSLLEEFRCDVFHGQANIAAHLDRVTLFKKKARRWRYGCIPVSDWLVTVERAGHMTRKRRKWFRVKDDGQVFEGVAGATWREGRTMLVEGLPELRNHPPTTAIRTYAQRSFITEPYIRKKLEKGTPFPRSLCGIMVEVEGSPWGVIVIDSQFENLVTQGQVEVFYQKNAKSLAKLLAVL